MPIKYIQFFAKRNGNLQIKQKIAPDTHLAVDGDALLYYLYIQYQNFSYGGDSLRLYDSTIQFFEKLEKFKVRVTVFIPGATFENEQNEKERGDIRVGVCRDFMAQVQEEPGTSISRAGKGFRFHVLHRQTFIQALRDAKVEYVCCDGPVTPFVADFAIQKQVPVLAYDSVYLMHQIPAFYHIDSIYLKEDIFEVQAISPIELAKFFELDFERFQLLCRLTPNEVIQAEFAGVRNHFGENRNLQNGKDQKDNMLLELSADIRAGKNVTDLIEKYVALELQEQKATRARHDQEKNELEDKVMQYQLKLEAAKKAAEEKPDTTSVVEAATRAAESLRIVKEHRDNWKDIAADKNEAELRTLLVTSGTLCARLPFDNVQVNTKSIPATLPKWVLSFFKFGKLPAYLLEALEFGTASIQPSLEAFSGDYDFVECAALAGLELRKVLYGLVGLKTVNEWKRQGDVYTKSVVPCSSAVNLVAMTKLSADERLKTVLKLALQPYFEKADTEVANIVKVAKSANSQILFAAYKILIKICQKIPKQVAAALITSSFAGLNPHTVQKVSGLQQITRNIAVLHYAAALQHIIEPILSINQLLGAPLAVLPQHLFSGPTILMQYALEVSMQSLFTTYSTYKMLSNKDFQLCENMLRFADFKRGGNRERVVLTKPEMQFYEHREEGPEFVALVNDLVFLKTELFVYTPEEEVVEEVKEHTTGKKKGVDFTLTKVNKFGGLFNENNQQQE